MTKSREINQYEARRRQAGLSRQELADRLGVSKKTIENWEYGTHRPHKAVEKILERTWQAYRNAYYIQD